MRHIFARREVHTTALVFSLPFLRVFSVPCPMNSLIYHIIFYLTWLEANDLIASFSFHVLWLATTLKRARCEVEPLLGNLHYFRCILSRFSIVNRF